jgi:hypothetical protein
MTRMSLVCRQMRCDVHSYFYMHNRFVVHVPTLATGNYDFLRDIKSDGRRQLHHVFFPDLRNDQWSTAARRQLLALLLECSNLQELTLCLELYNWVQTPGTPVLIWPNALSRTRFDQMRPLRALTNISRLLFMCDFNPFWLGAAAGMALNTLRRRVKSGLKQLAKDIASRNNGRCRTWLTTNGLGEVTTFDDWLRELAEPDVP